VAGDGFGFGHGLVIGWQGDFPLAEEVGIEVGFQAALVQGLFGLVAHLVGVDLGEVGAGVINVYEIGAMGAGHFPGPGKRIEAGFSHLTEMFLLEGAKTVHQGDGDVGEDSGAAGGDLVPGEGEDEAGEKDGEVADGAEFAEVADELGGGVFLGAVAMAEGRSADGVFAGRGPLGSGGRRGRKQTAAASGGEAVRTAAAPRRGGAG